MSKARGYCFTINNPSDQDHEALEKIECRYMVIGKEVGENGTPHIQGYVLFKSPRSFEAVKKLMLRAHIEVQRGTSKQAADYCKKDGNFVERGEPPKEPKDGGDMEKRRWDDAFAAAKEGRMEDISAELRIKHYRTFKQIKTDYMVKPPDAEDVTGVWMYGAPGVGKSRTARERYPNAYFKLQNKWWDGYQGEEYVILDDFDSGQLGYLLKIWGDRYSFGAETKGGHMHIRPKKIVVTSNYAPNDPKFGWDPVLVEAITRRFKVEHFLVYRENDHAWS